MNTRNFIFAIIPALVFLLLPSYALSGSFNVMPLKIFFDANKKTDNLTIKNEGDKDVTLKAKIYTWTQDAEGKDVLTESNDITFMPKIMTVKAGKDQRIKLGYDKPGIAVEKTYRIIVEEVPQADPSTGGATLRMALRISVPIFIAPLKKGTSSGAISDVKASKGGAVSFIIKNNGSERFTLKTVVVKGYDSTGKEAASVDAKGWYVLAGARKPFALTIPPDKCEKVAKIEIVAETDTQLTIKQTVNADKNLCSK